MGPRILIINWQDRLNPFAGGAEVHLHEVFGRLARRGWDITLLVSGFAGGSPQEELDGMRVVRVGSRNTFNLHVPGSYRRLQRQFRFDLVIDDLNKIPFFSPLYAENRVAALVHHFFDRSIYAETWFLPATYVYLTERFVAPVYRRCWFGAVSNSTRDDLAARGIPKKRIRLVPNGVDLAAYGPDERARASHPSVGYFGRLKRYKSVDHLLLAFREVRKQFPDAELLIVGDGDDRPRLERVAEKLGLGDCTTFTGRVDHTTKVELLRRMWVCVNPSPREGWGLTVTEANACGTPVVAADSPGLRDSVRPGETGFLYPYGDIGALADKLSLILRDSDLRRSMSEKAVEWAAEHSWDRAAECAEEFLLSALANASAEV